MKKILTSMGLAAALLLSASPFTAGVYAQTAPAAALAAAPAADAKKDEAKPAEAPKAEAAKADEKKDDAKPAPAAAKPPEPNKGDFTFMYIATILVIMMTIPGLALFYGGLVRSKNMLSVLMQVFVTFCLISILWVIYGYSVAFTSGNPFFGGFSKAFLSGVDLGGAGATFSKGVYIPEMMFAMFQLTFAAITPA
ncbi:MAG: ammonia channel protein, partial [Burkholderiales bacterium]